jgi:predicted transglutaminase-like cysteine proteinase
MALHPDATVLPSPRNARHAACVSWRSLILCLVAQLTLSGPVMADAFDRAGIFGESGKEFNSLRALPKWSGLLARYQTEQQHQNECLAGKRDGCGYEPWERLLERLRAQDKVTQIREINRFVNSRPYITDPTNWGDDDYWATPKEFFATAGDCEDYAITKFLGLRELGFANEELRLVAVEDRKRNVKHTVTLVAIDDRVLLLDNELDAVVPANAVRHYKPVFAANETVWWLFR